MKKIIYPRSIIIHVINSLGPGGAELLLFNTIQLFPEFRHIIVYLQPPHDLRKSFKKKGATVIYLNNLGWKALPLTALRLNAIIRRMNPLLVHSHLFFSTICTRLALPKNVFLVSTIHSLYSLDAFGKNINSLLAAKATLRKRHALIAVSKFVLNDYLKYISFSGKSFVLHNFLPAAFFKFSNRPLKGEKIRLMALGNLKDAKNYFYLVEIFKHLEGVTLDIYGTGTLFHDLRREIESQKLEIRLCGPTSEVASVFKNYDFFIQASRHEGFGLSVIEAMASGIPVLLSDIPVFREITKGHACFFPLNDAEKAAEVLKNIFKEGYPENLARKGFDFVKDHYSEHRYRKNLLKIYHDVSGHSIFKVYNKLSYRKDELLEHVNR